MKSKSIAYMLVAIVVGYTLMASVPEQIEMFATPQRTFNLDSGDGGETPLLSEDELEQAASEATASKEEETAEDARDAPSGFTSIYMGSWWIIDMLIALGVYFWAKKRFS